MKYYRRKLQGTLSRTNPTDGEEISKEQYRLKLDDALESNIARVHKAFMDAQEYQTATLARFDSR